MTADIVETGGLQAAIKLPKLSLIVSQAVEVMPVLAEAPPLSLAARGILSHKFEDVEKYGPPLDTSQGRPSTYTIHT